MIKKIIANLFDKKGYTIIRKGSLKTITGDEYTLTHEMIPRNEHVFSHFMIHGYPDVPFKSYEVDCTPEDVLIAERLLNSFHIAIKDEADVIKKPEKDVWEILREVKHKEFIQLLHNKDPKALAVHLCNMSKYDITHGLSQGSYDYNQNTSNEQYRRTSSVFFKDKLVSLGEALGCLPVECPELGRWGENLYINTDELIEKIENILGIDITPSSISGGLFGISTKKGILHFRDINSIYTAWRIREITKAIDNPAVCEIGAGTGRSAYYCIKMGIKNYTIIDLPYVSMLSGYYLLKSYPEKKIILYGEEYDDKMDSIKILPYWCFNNIPDNFFDLTFNQDSFPEIEYDIVVEYLKQIKRNTKRYFLSINQESKALKARYGTTQVVVSELIKEIGDSYEQVYRFPYWIRKGYIEELYRIGSD
ncbi:MAG: putative sugar O-methyltransferase [Nitrospira sp.]|nr:putative sugar O-methyltransferase [Nitrospira sp.]